MTLILRGRFPRQSQPNHTRLDALARVSSNGEILQHTSIFCFHLLQPLLHKMLLKKRKSVYVFINQLTNWLDVMQSFSDICLHCQVIYVMRNPKDVMVSFFQQHEKPGFLWDLWLDVWIFFHRIYIFIYNINYLYIIIYIYYSQDAVRAKTNIQHFLHIRHLVIHYMSLSLSLSVSVCVCVLNLHKVWKTLMLCLVCSGWWLLVWSC